MGSAVEGSVWGAACPLSPPLPYSLRGRVPVLAHFLHSDLRGGRAVCEARIG